jgi:hypothetical protein
MVDIPGVSMAIIIFASTTAIKALLIYPNFGLIFST